MTRFAGPQDSPGFLLWHATLRWQRDIASALEPFGLTHAQFVLLACADWLDEGDGVRQNRIAEQAGTDAVMTSEVLRRLEAKGLVRRDLDPADARARLVRVTPTGQRAAIGAIDAVEAVDAAFFGDADPVLVDALRRAADR